MKRLIFIILPLLITGCATIGTKTIYRTAEVPAIRTIAYSGLKNIEFLNTIFPETDKVFRDAITQSIEKYGFPSPVKLYDAVPETKEIISQICEENDLDAFLFTELQFIHTTYSLYFVPVGTNFDTEVVMRLYDRRGNLLYSTLHNTLKGNSYMMSPSTERTVKDGVQGAFKRIAKEMNLRASEL